MSEQNENLKSEIENKFFEKLNYYGLHKSITYREKSLIFDCEDISENIINDLFSVISEMTYLEILDIKNAGIILPDSIGNLEELRYLILSHNELKSLPESIRNLKELKKIDISGNGLESVPESIINHKCEVKQ
jgi:Leucine-rich repeat (LRR) protein